MDTQAQTQRLAAGQMLWPSRGSQGPAVLAEGELMVQAPPRWLAGTFVLPPPVRFVAPAVVELSPSDSVIAVRASTVMLQQAAPRFAIARWFASRRPRVNVNPA